jgi:3-oxoacyl-[acyl-carrier protein] reductase
MTGVFMPLQENKALDGRVAIITGAAGGIGRAIAVAFAREGADLCLCDTAPLDAVTSQVQAFDRRVLAIGVDVTQRTSIDAMVARVEQELGRFDILVNVAGVVSFGSAADLTESEWDRVIDINLKGTFLCCQAVIGPMRRRGFGRIINLGSIIGKNGGNPRPWIDPGEQRRASNVAYGVSKAGVHAMTFFLARELASDGITVNAIAPGPVASDMTTDFPAALQALIPVGRMGKATEIAAAARFLASEDAAFITGEVLDVNGGMWAD